MDNKNLYEKIGELLIAHDFTIAFAESATAGRLSADFSLIEDAGKFLKGGVVCYDACIKEDMLHVDHELIEKYTPESMEVTEAITYGLSKIIKADIHIGVTGLTCPGGSESESKPVGTMFIYGSFQGAPIFAERIKFDGNKSEIIAATVSHCATLLYEYLQSISR